MKSKKAAYVIVAIVLLFGGLGRAWARTEDSGNSLYQGFKDPPKEYDLIPLWTWNGKMDVNEAKHQIDLMLAQGIRRAIVYPFPNMRIRFLSEDWWSFWGELLAYARQKNFQLGVNAENEWPDGDARDSYLPPPDQSHVLLGHPEYHMKCLSYVERHFVGPGSARFNDLPNPVIAIAMRFKGPGVVDGDNLIDLSAGISGSSFTSDLPSGNWRLMFFYLENTMGLQGLHIDPLNHDAVARFIDLTLGEYYRRFKRYFGNTFTFVLVDHEGTYGRPIAWTPTLFDTFRREKGYDLKKFLPLLAYDGGKLTPKVRIDYLRVISDLYQKNYWGQIARWCEAHGLQMTAQGLSDSLLFDVSRGGDYMAMMRALTMPGVEAIGNHGRSPREFVEDESIADFEGKRYWMEGPLVLGAENFISPQKERYATNMLALWGINLWSPQFYMDPNSLDYPPDVFISQPWWKFFRQYTDYVRRVSYMNGGGKHVVNLLLYRPLDTIFAYSDPVFSREEQNGAWPGSSLTPDSTAVPTSMTSEIRDSGYERGPFGLHYYPLLVWSGNYAATVETAYLDLMEMLTGNQSSYDIVDDYYLQRMQLEQGKLRIAGLSFRGIILPPMKVISRKALTRIRQFYDQGGLVVAYGSLPSASSEEGRDDPAVIEDIKAIFGVDPGRKENAQNQNAQGGKAYFVVGNVENVLRPISENVAPDLEVVRGPRNRILYSHRVKDGEDLFWVVNDTDTPRDVVISLAAHGKPELWNPATGERREVAFWTEQSRTIVPLNFNAWDATYLVLQKGALENSIDLSVARTNLSDFKITPNPSGGAKLTGQIPVADRKIYVEGTLAGKSFQVAKVNSRQAEPQVLSPEGWTFRPASKEVLVRYARERLVRKGEGVGAGFELPSYNDQTWKFAMLSPRENIVRRWWVLGPFPNPNFGEGFNIAYPPEQTIDLNGSYRIAQGEVIGWRRYYTTEPEINLSGALGSEPEENSVGYAMTWVYASRTEQVEALIVGKNVKLWVNGNLVFARNREPMYFELRDSFGIRRTVSLKAGWNQVLVKVAGAHRGPALVFYLRFTDSQGTPVPGLTICWSTTESELRKAREADQNKNQTMERWYRADVPAGTVAVKLPQRPAIQAVYLNGKEMRSREKKLQFTRLDFSQRQVLALRLQASDSLREPLEFISGDTQYRLGNWSGTGLTYYAGGASYTKDFTLRPGLLGDKLVLDCGRAGVAAELWLNGQKVGDRIWEPFTFDVTKLIKPGKNHLEIVVTNQSDAAIRAIPGLRGYLQLQELAGSFISYVGTYPEVIDPNGLIGPVQLVPYREVELSIPAP